MEMEALRVGRTASVRVALLPQPLAVAADGPADRRQ
jgi:hypothetical protein